MNINEIPKEEYGDIYNSSEFSFLQSLQWAELKKADGYIPRFFRINDNSVPKGACLVLTKKYPIIGAQAYIPRPLFFENANVDFSQCGTCVEDVTEPLRREFGVVLIDMDLPASLLGNQETTTGWVEQAEQVFAHAGFETGKTIQPGKTAMIDLAQTEEEWRASCRKSAKERIKAGMDADAAGKIRIMRIDRVEEPKELDLIIGKIVELSEEKFSSRKTGYLKRMVELFGDKAVVWTVRAGDKCAGGSIGILDGNQKIYHTIYSAVDRVVLREHNAGYLLKLYQWRLGHELGYRWLDMWGVETDPNHPWYGFSQFKLGFGAKIVEYPKQFRLFRSAVYRATFSLARQR